MAVSQYLRSVQQAASLGWKLDSNWTDPALFAIYYLIRPLSSLLIVGFMFIVATAATHSFYPPYFAYIFVGTAFFVFMTQLSQTMAMLIPEEKARYETMRQIYISPSSIRPYIVGRSLAAIFNASISVILTFILGDLMFTYLFHEPLAINFLAVNYPALFLSVALGIVAMTAVGYILSAVSLVSNRLQFSMSEYATGIFLLFGGVWFQPSILPPVAAQFSSILPITWFLASVRASMIAADSSSLGISLFYLAISSVASVLAAYTFFAICERFAKNRGIIDRKAEG
jgi:ABC-2 type transport system permease protein